MPQRIKDTVVHDLGGGGPAVNAIRYLGPHVGLGSYVLLFGAALLVAGLFPVTGYSLLGAGALYAIAAIFLGGPDAIWPLTRLLGEILAGVAVVGVVLYLLAEKLDETISVIGRIIGGIAILVLIWCGGTSLAKGSDTAFGHRVVSIGGAPSIDMGGGRDASLRVYLIFGIVVLAIGVIAAVRTVTGQVQKVKDKRLALEERIRERRESPSL